jgi:hypothetical protein
MDKNNTLNIGKNYIKPEGISLNKLYIEVMG